MTKTKTQSKAAKATTTPKSKLAANEAHWSHFPPELVKQVRACAKELGMSMDDFAWHAVHERINALRKA